MGMQDDGLHLLPSTYECVTTQQRPQASASICNMSYYGRSYWSDYVEEYYRARRLEQENSRLSNEKRELERQLAEKKRTAQVSSTQVLTLGHKVRELERQNTGLSGELSKQREDTREAGLLFISAADRYQEEAKKQIRAKAEELENTRKACLMLMNTADTYQEAARKQIKEKAEEMEDARKAVLALMKAADAYQEEAKKKIKDKEQELKVMGAQKAELDAMVESLESRLKAALAKNLELEDDYGKVKAENDNLRLEVEEDASAKAFDAEKKEILTELEDLKMKVEVTQGNKDLMEGENDKLQLDAFTGI
ncbi:cingulin-like [Triticum dicoccoides]|uniref:cingulin-like n=1 Tax=Triticum dicoccoides TaxID=85692 RepID=UPI00188F8636|nr:cingulin-like [Triticum dicoccoides]